MNDHEQEKFEMQLRRIKPAKPPEEFLARMLAVKPEAKAPFASRPPVASIFDTLRMLPSALRWLIPATAVALTAVVVWRGSLPSASRTVILKPGAQVSTATVPPVFTADDVKIDQQLVSSFDAIARLPGGEPVRFRCESWMDQIVLSDKSRGLVVENRTPRFEVIPVGFETY